jgi:MarR family transcriptional regulator, 2-MHQ and catechol-resistance regulon repressor
MSAHEGHVEGCYDPRLGALNLLWDIRVGLTTRLAPIFESHGIAEHDFDAVLQLVRAPAGALRMSDLAQKTGSSTSGMTRVVDRLERQGLVRREAHPTDRRASVVRLTPEGVVRVRALLPDLLAGIERWFTGQLDDDRLEQVLTSLDTVRGGLLGEDELPCRPDPTPGRARPRVDDGAAGGRVRRPAPDTPSGGS